MKSIAVFLLLGLTIPLTPRCCRAQGEAAVPFLLISPYAETNGMGEASVANHTDDPLAFLTNPAHLGMQSQRNLFSFGYNHSYWLPQFQQSDLWLRTFAFNAGINLKKQFGITPELSFGLGYSRIYLNLGEFNETGPNGPDILSTFKAYETSDQYTIGVGINYWVKASAGVTFKHILSSLAPFDVQGQARKGVATVDSYDYGLLLDVPFLGVVSQLKGEQIEVFPGLSPFFDLSVGLAKNNLGNKQVVYIDAEQADPLPRNAMLGLSYKAGFTRSSPTTTWEVFSFTLAREAEDILVQRFPAPRDSNGFIIGDPPPPQYLDGSGAIEFFNNVILGEGNARVTLRKGWQINLGELVLVRGGSVRGRRVSYTTSGYGLRLAGVLKILNELIPTFSTSPIPGFILAHIDIRLDHASSEYDDRNNSNDGVTYTGLSLLVK